MLKEIPVGRDRREQSVIYRYGAILKKDTDMHHTEDLSGKRMIISAVATLVCLIVLYVFYIGLIRHEFSSERDRYSYIARNEAEHIVTTIDCVMARTNTLKALIQDHDGDTSFFNDVAESIYNDVIDETGVTLKNFALAPDGVVSDVYPLEGNEALIGFDFLDMSRPGNPEAKKRMSRAAPY